jgi:hypothetical protein
MTAPQPLSFWVRTLDMLLQDEFARAADATGLDPGQWQVLTRLRVGALADDVLRGGLAPFMPADEKVDDAVGGVVKDGLVEHQTNEYRLTDRGFDRVAQIEDQVLGGLHGRAFEGVSPEERDALLSTLERVATNLGWQPA